MTDLGKLSSALAAIAVCVAATWPIAYFVDECWKKLGWSRGGTGFARIPWLVSLVGVVERSLFVLALHIGQPEFIGLWLTLKIASQWNQWSSDSVQLTTATVPGRAVFQVFLLGNAFSILFAFLAFKVYSWLQAGLPPVQSGIAVLASATLTFILGFLVRKWRVT